MALAACLLGLPGAAAGRFIDYVYVEPNEGGSSGGHVALRIDSETFHFQQAGEGLLRLQRDNSDAFDFRYSMLGNRPVHITRIAVADDTADLVRDAFTRRLLVEAAQFEHLEALRADVALFEDWRPGAPPLAVRGAGYFSPAGAPLSSIAVAESPALVQLRARVAATHGAGFAQSRTTALRGELAAWRPRARRDPAPRLASDSYPLLPPTASSSYAALLAGLTALDVLDAAPVLAAGTYRTVDDVPPLDAAERAALERFGERLAGDLAALVASPRPDFGEPLLLGMARLAAIEASLAGKRLVVLDGFAADAQITPLPAGTEGALFLDALIARLRPSFDRTRIRGFKDEGFKEADYARLESAANWLIEVRRAQRDGTPLRIGTENLTPSRPARRTEPVVPPLPASGDEHAAARNALDDFREKLAEPYRYNLFVRNCVTELFATIEAGLAAAGGDVEAESRRRLGGVVRTGATLNFIPAVSARAVAGSYAATGTHTLPSYRQLRLQALAAEEPAWLLALRESNTLTATTYHPDTNDSAFLFFTDDAPALRPLLGAVNLAVGIAGGVLGLATWPADGGSRLRAGWMGALFSLPELAFINIRKGSMAWVEPDLGSVAAP